jgi:hypothetical protein
MNPVTFNDRFVRALKEHPERAYLEQFFANWQVAPLFDYETTFEKEVALTPQGIGLDDMQHMPWPFETFRLSLVERDVPRNEKDPDSVKDIYKTHLVARRDLGQLQLADLLAQAFGEHHDEGQTEQRQERRLMRFENRDEVRRDMLAGNHMQIVPVRFEL